MLQLPSTFDTHIPPSHPTEGLPGFPAMDFFAPSNTKVCAPFTGKVIKLSGHPPTPTSPPGGPYGWSIYLQRRDGSVAYLTHFQTRAAICKLGACIGVGEVIGTVARYKEATNGVTPSHIHFGLHVGPWAP